MIHVKEGAVKAGKLLNQLTISVYTSFSIAADIEKATKAVVPVAAYIVAGSPEIILQKHSIDTEKAAQIRDAIVHGKWKEAFAQVTPEMIEAFSICGTPEIVTEKIAQLTKIGATQIVAGSPIGPNMRKSINMIAAEIFPRFKQA
jgi:5,10-methylenetetrahydromethanopterin reductase